MRFFRYSLLFAFLFITIALGIIIATQEWVLFKANNQLLADVGVAQKARQDSEYYEYCKNLGTEDISDSPLYYVQLRFISDTEYVTEVLCDQYEFAPKQISQHRLPLFATKKAGRSGFVFLEQGSGSVALQAVPKDLSVILTKIPLLHQVFFRTKVISVENGSVLTTILADSDPIRPITNCAGYGFTCCDPIQKLGLGDQRPASDCSDDCYASCQQRPIILSFNGEPGFDRYQRVLQVSQSESVIFNFVIETLLPEMSQVTLDFGDGTSWTGLGTEITTTHLYACAQAQCNFRAELHVIDAYKTQSAPTTTTQIQVIVHQ